MSEGSADEFPFGMPALVSSIHPVHGDAGGDLTMADMVRLLDVGDQVLWQGRKVPLEVIGRDESREIRYHNGQREVAFKLEGPRGGLYIIDNWWHWGDEGDGIEDAEGCYPQVHRVSGGAWEDGEHFDALAIDGPVETGPGWDGTGWDVEDMEVLVYDDPISGEHHAGRVVRVEFGQPVVEPLDLQPKAQAEHTVDAASVIGYRREA